MAFLTKKQISSYYIQESYAQTSRWEDNGVKKKKTEAEFNGFERKKKKKKIQETLSTKLWGRKVEIID